MKKPAWSFSMLEGYELCPKKFFKEKIEKSIPFRENEASRYGKIVHKKFEDRMVRGAKLPLDLKHHERVLKRIADAPGEGLGEQKLALNESFEPTGYFDDDVWMRGIVDYTKINNNSLLVVDWKTGKIKDDFTQIKLMMAVLTCYWPEVEQARGMFYWTKLKKPTSTPMMDRKDITNIWNDILPRVEAMYEAIEKEEFPARQNFLCRNYCDVKSCPYNGG